MKKLIFCTLLLYSSLGIASFYHFDKIQKTIAPAVFNRYVRPQIRYIVRDYFFLIASMGSLNTKVVALKKLLKQSNELFAQIQKQIGTSNTDNKYENIKRLLLLHYSMDNEINLLLQSTIRPQDRSLSYGDSIVIFRDKLSRFFRDNLEMIRHIEEILLISNTPYQVSFNKSKLDKTMLKKHSLNLNFDQLVTLLLPIHFREDFQSLYMNFISLLENHVLIERRDDYLMTNLEKFNNLWNVFHMKITKSAIIPDKKISDTISSMHRNWNSLLKIIL